MTYETIITEQRGRVLLITLNRPEALNALNRKLAGELLAATQAADADPSIGCLVITGSAKAFAAGLSSHGEEILAFGAIDAVGFEPARDGGEAIAFLDAQLLQSLHQRLALCEGGGDGEHGIFVDHGRRAFGRHGHAA